MTETIDKIKAFVMANKKLVAIAGGALLLLILIIAIIAGAGGSRKEYKPVAIDFCEALFMDNNAGKALKTYNKKMIKAVADMRDLTEKEYEEELQEIADEIKDYLKDEDIKKKDIRIEKSDVDKSYTIDDDALDEINDELRDGGYKGKKITKAMSVSVKVHIDGGDNQYVNLTLGQISKKWYVINYNYEFVD